MKRSLFKVLTALSFLPPIYAVPSNRGWVRDSAIEAGNQIRQNRISGFDPSTSVLTPEGWKPLGSITPGNQVISLGKNGPSTVSVHEVLTCSDQAITLVVDGERISVQPNQLFLTSNGEWKQAYQLRPGQDEVATINGGRQAIESVEFGSQQFLVDLTVSGDHNFIIEKGLVTHNFVIVIPLGIAFAEMFTAAFLTEVAVASVAATAVAVIGNHINRDNSGYEAVRNIPAPSYQAGDFRLEAPTEADGFKPPKPNKGGDPKLPEKVPNGKHGQKGWKDKGGNYWCPDNGQHGAHGGPHWDIIGPDGRHIENVYPGGRRR